MDRLIVYPASIPLDTDVLTTGRNEKEALGRLLDCVYGQSVSSAYGFTATLSSAALSVTFGPGIVNAWGVVDATAIGGQGGGLAANTTPVTNQYLADQPQTLTLLQNGVTYTVYAQCAETDNTAVVLPFYNAANPAQTQAGPGNTGQDLPTRRAALVTLVAATSPPTPPPNGAQVALYTIAVPAGATTAATCKIAALAPFYLTLPELQALVQSQAPGRLLRADVITTVGTNQWTPPPGANTFRIRMVGGGGSGGYAAQCTNSNETSAGGAGGAGAYMEFLMSAVNMGAVTANGSVSITIGAGGVANQNQFSGNGEATTFGVLPNVSGTLATCGGGYGGCYGGPTPNSTSTSAAQAYGGAPGIGNQNLIQTLLVMTRGAIGSSGMCFNGANWPALGVDSPLGSGGGNSDAGSGTPGQGYGSSGAGGGSSSSQSTGYLGGNGAPGCVIIESYT